MSNLPSRRCAILALLLLVPVPSLSTWLGMWALPGPVGSKLFFAGKVWIVLMPTLWWLWVEKGRLSLSPPRQGGMLTGALLGVGISAIIVAAYYLVGRRLIDGPFMRQKIIDVGLATPAIYLAGMAYWILINSVIEEYVYRWFIFRQVQALTGAWPAVAIAAAVFTAHHVIALSSYLDWPATALASFGVFVGGATWSWCYLKYRSIWPGYLSHAIVDVAVFAIGYQLVFG